LITESQFTLHLVRTSFHVIQFLTSDIFYSLLSYYSTVNFNQNYMIFKPVEWFRHISITLTFLFSPPWRWPHEWPKQVGEPLCNKTASIKPSAFLGFVILLLYIVILLLYIVYYYIICILHSYLLTGIWDISNCTKYYCTGCFVCEFEVRYTNQANQRP